MYLVKEDRLTFLHKKYHLLEERSGKEQQKTLYIFFSMKMEGILSKPYTGVEIGIY